MRNFVITLALAGALIAGPAATPALYAQESQGPDSSMKGPDMQRMMKMMEKCDKMMQGGMMGAPGLPKPSERERDSRPPK
jgi:hypothetical protein